jgi:hypothetical protein
MSLARFWSGKHGLTLITISLIVLIFIATPLRETGLPLRILSDVMVAALLTASVIAVKQGRVVTAVPIAAVFASAVVLTTGRLHPTALLHLIGSGLVTITLLLYMWASWL